MVADEGMQVVVRPGACLIEGATGYETEDRTMVVQAAGATDRIDSVVLRLNDNIDYRDIDLYVIKGNSSSEPPELTRTGGVYEIGLANLYVSANSSTITTERITDTRLVTERCGYAMPVQKFDTTALFDQLQAQVNENIELIQRAINQTEAAHLQEQIDSISSDIGTTSIASISDGTLKGAVAKHEQDVNSLNLKMDGKQRNLSQGIFTGSIDKVNADGSNGSLKENSIVWVHSAQASGGHPPAEYYLLETLMAGTGIIVQRATQYIYQGAPVVYERMYVNEQWSNAWAKLN